MAIWERAECRPRWATAKRVLRVLHLTPAEARRFALLWALAAIPDDFPVDVLRDDWGPSC